MARKLGIDTVVGFTGSSIWPCLAMFPPVPESRIEAGFDDEDAGMDRLHGAQEANEFVRGLLWDLPTASFDAAFWNQS